MKVLGRILLNSSTDGKTERRKDVRTERRSFFVRCRRTYVLKKIENFLWNFFFKFHIVVGNPIIRNETEHRIQESGKGFCPFFFDGCIFGIHFYSFWIFISFRSLPIHPPQFFFWKIKQFSQLIAGHQQQQKLSQYLMKAHFSFICVKV